MSRVPTGRYSGAAELLVDGDKVADVTIEIHGSKRELTSSSLAGGEDLVEGGTERWDGRILSADRDLRDLHGDLFRKVFTLRTPDGRETTAWLSDDRGTLGASSSFPFDA